VNKQINGAKNMQIHTWERAQIGDPDAFSKIKLAKKYGKNKKSLSNIKPRKANFYIRNSALKFAALGYGRKQIQDAVKEEDVLGVF